MMHFVVIRLLFHLFPDLLGLAHVNLALLDKLLQSTRLFLQQFVLNVNIRRLFRHRALQLPLGLQLIPFLLKHVHCPLETVLQQKISEKIIDLLHSVDPFLITTNLTYFRISINPNSTLRIAQSILNACFLIQY